MPEFTKETVALAFKWSETFFGPIREESRKQNMDFVLTQLAFGVPERFLGLLEATEDPETVVNEAIARLKNFSPPYEIQPRPGEFLKDRFEEALAMQTASHIVNLVFGGPENGSRFSPLSADTTELHTFIKQKHEAALAESDADDDDHEPGEKQLTLDEEEKGRLIGRFSNALFSIHLLIRRISRRAVNPGQYL